jgi:opacity protein-like surface antigen
MQRRLVQMIVVLALAVLPAVPAAAADDGWTLRLYGAWARPDVDLREKVSDFPIRVGSNGAPGGGVGIEYCVRPWVGLGLEALHARPDIVLDADLPGGRRRVSDGLSFMPFSLGHVVHLTPGRAVNRGGSDVLWGVGAGIDIRPGASNWAIHAGVRLYRSTPEFTNQDNGVVGSVTFNPVVVNVGIGYRF